MSDPTDIAGFLDLGWQGLQAAMAGPKAARQVALATVSRDGAPEARTVVLRSVDRGAARVEIHTDLGSSKIASLQTNPRAEVLHWAPEPEVQLRLAGRVQILSGPSVAGLWPTIPKASRPAYGARPEPGTPIDAPFDYDKPGDPAGLAVLRCDLDRIEVMQLGARHRRAVFLRADGWRGQWVVP